MSSIGTGYDLSASQFSPDGRVFQIDYAGKAVEKSGTVIGLRGKDSVILAVEKIVTSTLYEEDAGARIFTVDKNIGLAIAGLLADGRYIVDIARQEAANYRQQFERTIPLKQLTERIAAYVHAYTLYSAVRPFGVSVLLSAWDEDQGAQLYKIEPSGSSFGYFACASGKAKQQAKTEMEKFNFPEMSTEDLVQNAGKIIYQVHDELKDKDFRYEMSLVGKETNGLHRINPVPWHKMAIEAGEAFKNEDDSDNEI
ncbi:Proteasome subunit alpha type-3 [Lucilia cuprina]|uniref:Proteasome subunit alpha type n=1 Tax=Lucilia cuprina TaxID=7375 RepID=A0A0L0BNF7_LUCCU|nr:proteasome subunit alpha type-3 [Lucilia cuprina]XP_037815579.1 proteasome subunit alpha type-3-like [Lucilia sericata]XP_037817235.1 proteasome subunit alpha type-3-like [Lucilia sericata]KAI8125035.1 Proteasome subunit alpha type-3 [Lucilia cuprina]KNC21567.1 Proteasome subunit alpha type-3 [Lucilia cuprina]